MAFHNPDPKLRELEKLNARHRAETFALLFRALGSRFRRLFRRIKGRPAARRSGRDCVAPCEVGREQSGKKLGRPMDSSDRST